MKSLTLTITMSLCVTWTAAAICPPEPSDLKPLVPPVGYSDTVHTCACDFAGANCRWVWVGVTSATDGTARQIPSANPLPASFLDSLINNADPAQRDRIQAQTAQTQAQTELLRQQTEALRLQNVERQHQLEAQGLIPHHATPGELREERAERQFNERLNNARRRHSDFNAVVDSEDFKPSPAMQKAMFTSKVAGELAYWLATHPNDSRRIAALPPDSAAREIRGIESTLK